MAARTEEISMNKLFIAMLVACTATFAYADEVKPKLATKPGFSIFGPGRSLVWLDMGLGCRNIKSSIWISIDICSAVVSVGPLKRK